MEAPTIIIRVMPSPIQAHRQVLSAPMISPHVLHRAMCASPATVREGDAKRVLAAELNRAREQEEESRKLRRASMLRCQELECSEHRLQEHVHELQARLGQLETQVDQGERRALERISRAEAEKGALREELERTRKAELESRDMCANSEAACKELEGSRKQLQAELKKLRKQHEAQGDSSLHHQLADLQERLRRTEAAQDRADHGRRRAEAEVRQCQERLSKSEQDIAALQRGVAEQRRVMWELENQLRQERNVSSLCTPGEFFRIARAHEGGQLAEENGRLKKELLNVQCDLSTCRAKLEAHEKAMAALQAAREAGA